MYRAFFFFSLLAITAELSAQDSKWKKWEVQADTLMNRGDFGGALPLYSKVIKSSGLKSKEDYRALYKRSVCHYSIGQLDPALADITKFIDQYPNMLQARILQAFIFRDKQDADRQLEALNQAIQINPGDPNLIKWRAQLQMDKGEYEKGKGDLIQIQSLQDPEVEVYLGVAYYNLGDKGLAIGSINKAIELDATYMPAYLYGGSFSLQEESYELAVKYLDMAIRLDPTNLTALFYKGIALVEMEKLEDGCRLLAQVFNKGQDEA
jgi:tetratricopeptide (TPR) repeat protein